MNEHSLYVGFWIAGMLLIGIASIYMPYYKPFVTKSWVFRFRIVDGIDHVGPVLETGQFLIVVTGFWLLCFEVFPSNTADLFARPVELFVWGLLLTLVSLYMCFIRGPREITADLALKNVSGNPVLDDSESIDTLSRIRVNYIPYLPFVIFANTALLITLRVSIAGLWSGWSSVNYAARALQSSVRAIGVSTMMIDVGPVQVLQQLLMEHVLYQDRLLDTAGNTMAVIGIVLLMSLWFFGTNFQAVYNRSVVMLHKTIACCLLFIILPAILLIPWFLFANTTLNVTQVFSNTVASLVQGSIKDSAIIEQVLDLRSYLVDQSSIYLYWSRMLSGRGGTIILVYALIVLLRKMIFKRSFLQAILPNRSSKGFVDALLGSGPFQGTRRHETDNERARL